METRAKALSINYSRTRGKTLRKAKSMPFLPSLPERIGDIHRVTLPWHQPQSLCALTWGRTAYDQPILGTTKMAQHTRCQAVWAGKEKEIHWGGLKTRLHGQRWSLAQSLRRGKQRLAET